MLKIWAKIILDNKIINQCVVDMDTTSPVPKMLEKACRNICYLMDVSNPIIQQKHINDIINYRITRFLPDSFIENVTFDRMEINIFEDKPKTYK